MHGFRQPLGIASIVVVVVSGALGGCHRATEADCDVIVDKLVELELRDQGITEAKTVETRKAETRARKRDELIKTCVGKRISASAMECIRKADAATDVTEKCLH